MEFAPQTVPLLCLFYSLSLLPLISRSHIFHSLSLSLAVTQFSASSSMELLYIGLRAFSYGGRELVCRPSTVQLLQNFGNGCDRALLCVRICMLIAHSLAFGQCGRLVASCFFSSTVSRSAGEARQILYCCHSVTAGP